MIYVLVEQDGAYSCKEWKVLGVFSDKHSAILYGFDTIINTALKPWNLKFYKKCNAKFSNAVALPEIHIEEWNIDGKKISNTFIGFQERPFTHFIDNLIKEQQILNKGSHELLLDWKKHIENGVIPNILNQLIFQDILP